MTNHNNNNFVWGNKTSNIPGVTDNTLDGFGNKIKKAPVVSGSEAAATSGVFGSGSTTDSNSNFFNFASGNNASMFGTTKATGPSGSFGGANNTSVFGAAPASSGSLFGAANKPSAFGAAAAPTSSTSGGFGAAKKNAKGFGAFGGGFGTAGARRFDVNNYKDQLIQVPLSAWTEMVTTLESKKARGAAASAGNQAQEVAEARCALLEQKLRGLVLMLMRISHGVPGAQQQRALASWLDGAGVSLAEAERWSGGELRARNWEHARKSFAELERKNAQLRAELEAARSSAANNNKQQSDSSDGGTATASSSPTQAHQKATEHEDSIKLHMN